MTQYLSRPEGRIAYDVEGVGPLVVCVPGMADLRSTFRHVMPQLVAAGFRVAAMDLRGHGDSDATFSSYDDPAAATDAVALIEHLGGPAIVVGSSMGAAAAVLAATDRPELVTGVALIGPFVRDQPGKRWMAKLFSLMLKRPWGPAVLRKWIPKLYTGALPADHAQHVSAMLASAKRPGRWRAFQQTARTSHALVSTRLSAANAPALVVMGEEDPDFPRPADEAAWIAERVGAEVLMVADAGHYPHSQRHEIVGPALVAFARRAFVSA